jgi:hypothetical protein
MTTRWMRTEQAVWEELNGEVVVVEPRNGRTWLLNAAAAQVWRGCDGEARRFSADGAEFCRKLAALGLLCAASAELAGMGEVVSFSGLPTIRAQGFGTGPRRRPSPRGLSGPG